MKRLIGRYLINTTDACVIADAGKLTTVIDGLDPKQINMHDLLKKLKGKMACGGAYKGNQIELQGDHRKAIIPALVKLGFEEGQIEVR